MAMIRKFTKDIIQNSNYRRTLCTSNSIKNSSDETKNRIKSSKEIVLPEEPTNCCMSGCQNCVWILYAKELTELYEDGGEAAKKIILEKIQDPSLKVFLKMELTNLDPK